MIAELFARKASSRMLQILNPWRPAIFDHPLPRRVFPGRMPWSHLRCLKIQCPQFPPARPQP
jgi:hypothetical protein